MSKKLAICVPHYNRREHLSKFIPHMDEFFKDKDIEYKIFVANQVYPDSVSGFNRGMSKNVAFDVARQEGYDYFCFHDIDMLPEDDSCDYSWVDRPTHLASRLSKFNYNLIYPEYIGGVTLFNKEHFNWINGFSNKYWGWGFEENQLNQTEIEKLLNLESQLQKKVIGQDKAVQSISSAIQRSRTGLSDPSRPIASFLFLGPTGVGKTELSKALASQLFDSENALIRIDMSEYMEKHSISRLIGAPPGYVGYEAGGQLTEAIRRKPYCVLLFDEIEKAHKDVFNVLLQILDEGRVTDGQGRTTNFKNTIIILTSNLGSELIDDKNISNNLSTNMDELINQELKSFFRPEFLNRLDEIINFEPLKKETLLKVVDLQLNRLRERLEAKGIELEIDGDVLSLITEIGYNPSYGARPLKRVIQKELESEIAKYILKGKYKEGSTIKIEIKESKLIFFGAPPG